MCGTPTPNLNAVPPCSYSALPLHATLTQATAENMLVPAIMGFIMAIMGFIPPIILVASCAGGKHNAAFTNGTVSNIAGS